MGSRRKSGGSFDFVAPDNELEPLDNKLGRHAKIGVKKLISKKNDIEEHNLPKSVDYESLSKQEDELKQQRQKERENFLNKCGKPSLGQRIKKFFGVL